VDKRVIGLIVSSALLAVVVLVVVIAGGGDDDGGGESASLGDCTAEASGEKPAVEVPEGDPPTELGIEDLEPGDGPAAKAGDQISVNYVGVLYADCTEFDNSFDRGEPFQFALGEGGVIPGWDQGVEGMKVGGRRQLTIPSDLAYGPEGQPPDIPPDSALVFVIDLVSIDS
jgi:peptidylprolyl isomerase